MINHISSYLSPQFKCINLHIFTCHQHTARNLHHQTGTNAKGVVHVARRFPLVLKERAIKTFHEMKANGYIVNVTEPTEWVSSMVVSVEVHICGIETSDLNNVVKRKHHPWEPQSKSSAQHLTPRYSPSWRRKADSSKLDEASSLLTKFNSPLGSYRWLRRLQSSAPPRNFSKDHGSDAAKNKESCSYYRWHSKRRINTEHYDAVLHKVIKRATSYNLKLNL